MSVHIGALQSIGIGKEATRGTNVNASRWIPKITGSMKPILTNAEDTGAYGTIDEIYDTQLVREMTETTMQGVLRDDFAGALMLGVFGQSAVAGAGPDYTHTFTRKNDNVHPSFTVHGTDTVGSRYSAYSMLSELQLTAQVGEFVTFNATFMGKKMTSESTPSVSFGAENPFRAKDVTVKFADTEGGLSGASATAMERLQINFAKNLEVYQALGSSDIDSIYNQQFAISGDFDALFEDTTLLGYVQNDTNKRMEITIENSDVDLGGGVYPTLTITLAKVGFDDWGRTDDNASVVRQTLGFRALHNASEGYSGKATIINATSTDYDA